MDWRTGLDFGIESDKLPLINIAEGTIWQFFEVPLSPPSLG